jgi:hypothetical protein
MTKNPLANFEDPNAGPPKPPPMPEEIQKMDLHPKAT